ncbi:MAG: hypothetical protein AAB071_05355 [Bacteroidota bacterium]
MNKHIFFFVLAFQIQCFSQSATTNIDSLSSIRKIIMFNVNDSIQLFPDEISIDSIKIVENQLSLFVNYGGCSKENITLYCSKYFLESYPVQADLYLSNEIHISPDCEMLIIEKLTYDLRALKETYLGINRIVTE